MHAGAPVESKSAELLTLKNSVVMWIGVSDKRHTNRYSDGQTDTERDMDMRDE